MTTTTTTTPLQHLFSAFTTADASTITPYCSIPDGLPYTQLFQHYPIISPLYTSFEANFHAEPFVNFARWSWPWLPLAIVAAYACMIATGTRVMANRERFQWRWALSHWNLLLSVFSFCGMARTVPHLLHNLHTLSFRDTICKDSAETYGEGACGLWVMLFIFSKVPELVDTVFVVGRKSKLHFLHWYHHMTVLLFCWHSYAVTASAGLYFVAMNFSVHAIMYGYYYLLSVKAWPKWIPAALITIAQIAQMIVGTGVCIASYYFYLTDKQGCFVRLENVVAGGLMYGSYLYLFVDFFVKRFLLADNSKGKKLQ